VIPRRAKRLAIWTLALAGGPAMAHHAFAPIYDGERTVAAQGTVTAFRFVNPHASLTLDAVDSSGNLTTWTVDFDGRVNLASAGWTETTIKPGESITVYGNPAHTGVPRMFFTRLVRADGSELLRPFLDRANQIDAQRRQQRRE